MSLAKKYENDWKEDPEKAVKKMVNDGVISCSWPLYDEIYAMFQNSMSIGGKTKTEIYYEISEKKGVSKRTVEYAIQRYK